MIEPQVIHLDNARYHGSKRALSIIDFVAWHTTEGHSMREAREWDDRSNSDNPASYTYGIERDGVVYRTNPLEVVPYCNGDSNWPNPIVATKSNPKPNHHSLNYRSVGIAFAGDINEPTHALAIMTEQQLTSAHWLARFCLRKLPAVTIDRNRGHREISPGRKDDPRPNFLDMDWWRLMITSDECPTFDSYRLHHA